MLDWLSVLIVLLAVSSGGIIWLSRWLPPAKAAAFVFWTVAAKSAVVGFRYYVAIGGSANIELTSDAYRYLSFGQQFAESGDSFSSVFLFGDETDRVVALSAAAFRVFGDSWLGVYVAGSFLSLIAMWLFWSALLRLQDTVPMWFGYTLCLFPSTLYWASSFGKESFTLFGVALGVYGATSFWGSRRGVSGVCGAFLIIIGVSVLVVVRAELAVLLVIALVSAMFAVQPSSGDRRIGAMSYGRLVTVFAVLPLALLAGPQLIGWGGAGLAENLFGRYENTSIGSSQLGEDRPGGIAGLVVGIPVAIFRPLPWEGGVTSLASSLDTVLIMIAVVSAVKVFRMLMSGRLPLMHGRVLLTSSVLVLGLFAALAGYGNLGLLVRMRSMAIPLLLIIVLLYVLVSSAAGKGIMATRHGTGASSGEAPRAD